MKNLDWGIINKFTDSKGRTLEESSDNHKVLLIFLRHLGCTYCRKVVSDFSKEFVEGKTEGFTPIFVHMAEEGRGAQFFESYGLKDAAQISDPERTLYEAFGLRRGSFMETLGPQVIINGVKDLLKFGVGMLEGDGFQMHGVFILEAKEIKTEFTPKHVADHVNLKEFSKLV